MPQISMLKREQTLVGKHKPLVTKSTKAFPPPTAEVTSASHLDFLREVSLFTPTLSLLKPPTWKDRRACRKLLERITRPSSGCTGPESRPLPTFSETLSFAGGPAPGRVGGGGARRFFRSDLTDTPEMLLSDSDGPNVTEREFTDGELGVVR